MQKDVILWGLQLLAAAGIGFGIGWAVRGKKADDDLDRQAGEFDEEIQTMFRMGSMPVFEPDRNECETCPEYEKRPESDRDIVLAQIPVEDPKVSQNASESFSEGNDDVAHMEDILRDNDYVAEEKPAEDDSDIKSIWDDPIRDVNDLNVSKAMDVIVNAGNDDFAKMADEILSNTSEEKLKDVGLIDEDSYLNGWQGYTRCTCSWYPECKRLVNLSNAFEVYPDPRQAMGEFVLFALNQLERGKVDTVYCVNHDRKECYEILLADAPYEFEMSQMQSLVSDEEDYDDDWDIS